MARRQIPLAPETVRTVQTAQGMSMDAAMIFMGKPGNMDNDDFWMHLYVMISRVRRSEGLLAFDVPDRRVFQRGPPTWVVDGIDRLEALCRRSLSAVVRVRAKLGWDPSEPSSVVRSSVPGPRATAAAPGCDDPQELHVFSLVRDGTAANDLSIDPGVGDLEALERLGALERGLRPGLRSGVGFDVASKAARCRNVKVVAGHDLLARAQPLQLQQLGLSEELNSVVMTSGRGCGLKNLHQDVCFLNAPLQMFLRLELVASALWQQSARHGFLEEVSLG